METKPERPRKLTTLLGSESTSLDGARMLTSKQARGGRCSDTRSVTGRAEALEAETRVGFKSCDLGPITQHFTPHPKTRHKNTSAGLSDSLVVKNPPANSGHAGLIPGSGRSHMPQSN